MQASSSQGGKRYKFDMRLTAIQGQEHSRYTLIRQQQSTPSPPPPAPTAATVSAASASQPEALAQDLAV